MSFSGNITSVNSYNRTFELNFGLDFVSRNCASQRSQNFAKKHNFDFKKSHKTYLSGMFYEIVRLFLTHRLGHGVPGHPNSQTPLKLKNTKYPVGVKNESFAIIIYLS